MKEETSKTTLPDADRQKKQIQELQKIKMEAIGRFSAGIAHDFNNLLTCIQGYSKLAVKRAKEGDPLREDLLQICKASDRAGLLTKQLLFFSRKQPMQSRKFSVNDTLTNLSSIMRLELGEQVEVTMELEPEVWPVLGDEVRIEQVIMSMLRNSKDAMPPEGKVTIKTENTEVTGAQESGSPEAKPGKYARVTIKDNGAGMGADILENIFEPFYTTKDPDKNSGLGLFMAYGIIKQHEGWIDYDSKTGEGAVFEIYLPAVAEQREGNTKKTVLLQDYQGAGESVLVVEDDESVRAYTSEVLSFYGYKVFEADSCKNALSVFELQKGQLDLLVSDVVLADGSGLQLSETLMKKKPGLPAILTSGFTDKKKEIAEITERGNRFLQKPYSMEDLLQVVKETINKK